MTNDPRYLYLVRHGQTSADKDQIIGATDQPLSIEGENQAAKLSHSLVNIEVAKLYSSQLDRAQHTARLLNSQLDIDSSRLLNEMNFGDWEGQTWAAVYDQDTQFFDHWAENWISIAPPSGEHFNDVMIRCRHWYNQISESDASTVIVAHGGSLRALLAIVLGLTAESAFNFEFHHCHVSKVSIGRKSARLEYLNNPCFR